MKLRKSHYGLKFRDMMQFTMKRITVWNGHTQLMCAFSDLGWPRVLSFSERLVSRWGYQLLFINLRINYQFQKSCIDRECQLVKVLTLVKHSKRTEMIAMFVMNRLNNFALRYQFPIFRLKPTWRCIPVWYDAPVPFTGLWVTPATIRWVRWLGTPAGMWRQRPLPVESTPNYRAALATVQSLVR